MPTRLAGAGALAALTWIVAACSATPPAPPSRPAPATAPAAGTAIPRRIAAGSCLRPERPAPVLAAVRAARPDAFVFLGDNVYADTSDPERMRAAYRRLASLPEVRELRARGPVLATWDDHDYGADDVGAEWPLRRQAQDIFLDAFGVAKDSPRRARAGVYHAEVLGPPGRRVQIILLDTRYHRTALQVAAGAVLRTYVPADDPAQSVLGAEQWRWLEGELAVPAELRLVVSSIQVLPEEHRFEKWANFPRERERLFRLLAGTTGGVVILSGDRHHSELGRREVPGSAPLWELTASSLNASRDPEDEPNRYRVGEPVYADNFGLVSIDWDATPPSVTLAVVDARGHTRLERTIRVPGAGPVPPAAGRAP